MNANRRAETVLGKILTMCKHWVAKRNPAWRRSAPYTAIMASYCMVSVVGAQSLQSIEVIRDRVHAYLVDSVPRDIGEVDIVVEPLDPRLRLAACDLPLEPFLPPGGRLEGAVAVGIRCLGAARWSIYTKARVRRFAEVWVTQHHLGRGTELKSADIRRERKDLAALTGGYILDTGRALGKRLKRSVPPGSVLVPAMLESPRLVRRGQRVLILARGQGMEVRMAGAALSHGAKGDVVRIKNLMTKKIIEGTVTSSGMVEVLL